MFGAQPLGGFFSESAFVFAPASWSFPVPLSTLQVLYALYSFIYPPIPPRLDSRSLPILPGALLIPADLDACIDSSLARIASSADWIHAALDSCRVKSDSRRVPSTEHPGTAWCRMHANRARISPCQPARFLPTAHRIRVRLHLCHIDQLLLAAGLPQPDPAAPPCATHADTSAHSRPVVHLRLLECSVIGPYITRSCTSGTLFACTVATTLGTRSRACRVHTPPRAEIQMTLLRTKTVSMDPCAMA
ncbi:hypothetical protein C8R44DRAFT_866692 [Mycena epipterygia]|nr:hypothetical protein C8R44DRAFT_866692 [Mycena epipterygia]